jgi:phosphate acetyltransferase
MSKLMEKIKRQAKSLGKTIVLAEGNDPRVIRAAAQIVQEKIAKIILLGDADEIASKAEGADLSFVTIVSPEKSAKLPHYTRLLFDLRKSKGVTEEQAAALAKNPLYFGVLMIKNGDADGMVAGSLSATGDVLRPALQIIKMPPDISSVSSSFIMSLPEGSAYGENGVLVFGDCAVNIDPDDKTLAATAIASAATARHIAGITPKVAMLSFSTKGSAKHAQVDKVSSAVRLVRELAPELSVDGELQADAALVEAVGQLKSPGSTVAGQANVLIFPSLEAGNIGYKLVQRLAGAEAVGPIIQGLAKPVNDLSRGCSVQDIVDVTAITALQSAAI